MAAAAGTSRNPSHEEVFLRRYNRLLKWANQLTKPDRELAKDLVQEAFIRFTVSAGNLVPIHNIDNYLHGIVRNTYRSHLRRNARQPSEALHSLEIEGENNLLLAVDPRRQMHVKDQLRAICRHACARKEKSITGSVLILRFFHGYLPREVAKVTLSSRNIVDVHLNSARAEALAFIGNTKMPAGAKRKKPGWRPRSQTHLANDLLAELREEIFATRRGDCFDAASLKNIYHTKKAVSRSALSHLVSCPGCLDAANGLLGLAPLRERNAIDVLGRASDRSSAISSFVSHTVAIICSWPLWCILIDYLSVTDYLC